MSKLSEYAALIPKGLPNSIQIIKALTNEVKLKYDKLPDSQKKEIIRRRFICSVCPFNSKNATTSQEYKSLTGTNYKTKKGTGRKSKTSKAN